jgi:hypothetical protein
MAASCRRTGRAVEAVSEPFTRRASRSLAERRRSLGIRAVGSGFFAGRRRALKNSRVKTNPGFRFSLRLFSEPLFFALLFAALGATAPALQATTPPHPEDRPAQLLAKHGHVSIDAAGPYVRIGTFLIQVATKLGQPDKKISQNLWLYHHRSVAGSAAAGTLVVRFRQGRVSEMAIVAPEIALALRDPAKTSSERLFARRD